MSPSPLRRPQVAQLTHRFRRSLAHITDTSAPRLRAMWEKLDQHNEAQVHEFERRAQPLVTSVKAATVQKAAGYYALVAGIRPPPVNAHHVPVEPDLRGPFIQSWQTLTASGDEQAALLSGAGRAEAAIANLVASAARIAGGIVYDQADVVVVGWERDPEPSACDWCLEAASETYSSAEATDFGHDRCMCIGVPLF